METTAADSLSQLALFQRFGLALVLGALVGLERETHRGSGKAILFAGIRTFSFISFFGCLSAFIAERYSPAFFPVAFAAVALLVATSHILLGLREDFGSTTAFATLLVFLLGALVSWGHFHLASAAAIVLTLLLSAKMELHAAARVITQEDLYAALKLAIVSVIVLPLLPNRPFGPLDVLNPFLIWLMVVFVSAVGFLGFVLVKWVGPRRGIGLTSLLGGIASSTAVTMSFAAQSREGDRGLAPHLASGIALSTAVTFGITAAETAVLSRELARALFLPMGAMAAVSLAGAFWLSRARPPLPESGLTLPNPLRLRAALSFGFLFALVLFAARAAQTYLGTAGLYLASAAGGVAGIDAAALTMARLASQGALDLGAAAAAVTLAAVANTLFKMGLVAWSGSPDLRRPVLGLLGAVVLTGLAAAAWLAIG